MLIRFRFMYIPTLGWGRRITTRHPASIVSSKGAWKSSKTATNEATSDERPQRSPNLTRCRTVTIARAQERAPEGISPVVAPPIAQSERATERSFEKLYRRHVHAVYRYALAVLHDEADAEDVTQTTFLNAYRAFQRGERPHRPHNWLIKIAHNVCRQRFRDSSRRPQEVEFDESLAAAATQDTDVPTAGEIRSALGFLTFNQRAALVMRELEGRSYAEIAEILDLSVGAIETLIFRARRALREQLEGGLTCEEAEFTLSRLTERKLSSSERGALRAHLRECNDCAVLERRQRAQRAALKNLGAVPLPASLAGSFFGGGAVGGGVAAGGMGIGAKIATVLAAGVVATGVGREAVEAVQASNAPAASRPVAVQDNPAFSTVSAITHGGVGASPIAARMKKSPRKSARKTNRFQGASKSMHGIATARPRTPPSGNPQSGSVTGTPSLPQLPGVTPPAIQVPQPPRVPVQLPVRVPSVQVPTVQLPPVPPPQLPLPPPPPLP
jgi:RNA polymerase sigma factor (sigma-70 family)